MELLARSSALVLLGLRAFAAVPQESAPPGAPVVRILATDPEPGLTLGAHEPLYLRIAYQSTEPLRFQSRAEQARRDARINPAPVYPAGSGEALAWISFAEAHAGSGLLVRVTDRAWNEVALVPVPAGPIWSGRPPASERANAPWVRDLRARERSLPPEPIPAGGLVGGALGALLMPLLLASVPGYLGLQLLLGLRWRGRWRVAALAPLAAMIPIAGWCVLALVQGSNLWPLPFFFAAPVAFLFLAGAWLVRRLATRTA